MRAYAIVPEWFYADNPESDFQTKTKLMLIIASFKLCASQQLKFGLRFCGQEIIAK